MNEMENYWESRYQKNDTGWDIKQISPPIQNFINQLDNKNLKILIPGSGNAYEAEYLFQKGFKNTFVADIAKTPLDNLKKRLPHFPKNQLLHIDFFKIEDTFDLIIEQTFFCVLKPKLRPDYAEKMSKLLKPQGQLVGLLFDFPLSGDEPPFGGHKKEYTNYFEDLFDFKTFERCYNSHPKRQGNELFFQFIKK